MTRIPDDHTGAQDIQRQLEAEGRARRGKPRRHNALRRAAVAIFTVAVAGGTVAGAISLVTPSREITGEPAAGPDVRRAPGDIKLADARAADPNGGTPDWGMRVYVSRTGATCVLVGRVVRGRLGVLTGHTFNPLSPDVPGKCVDLRRHHLLVLARRYAGAPAGRTVIYGIADRTIRDLSLVIDGVDAAVPIANDGTFLAVLLRSSPWHEAIMRASTTTGVVNQPITDPSPGGD